MKIDIINDEAINLLKALEKLKLIRLRPDKASAKLDVADWTKFKGTLTKQPLLEVEQQLNELRNEWE